MGRLPINLLLTATVAPASEVKTAVSNADARRQEYFKALLHYKEYLGRGIDTIVFVDNSNSDMEVFRQGLADDRIILHSYEGIKYPLRHGYGYGEMALVQHAMDNIAALASGLTIKVTGRYVVTNIPQLVKSGKGFDLAVDIWNMRKPWLDMRVMMWTPRGFETFLRDSYAMLQDDVNLLPPEMILARHVLATHGARLRAYLLSDPLVYGRRGMDGKDWGKGRLAMKRRLRALTRPIVRRLGLYPGRRSEQENADYR